MWRKGLVGLGTLALMAIPACSSGGSGSAGVPFDPTRFVEEIDNPFLPLTPGTTMVYEGTTDEGLERIETQVLRAKKVVLGVVCTVVHDRAFLDGELVESTFDWYAQDVDGNVWYFGEDSTDFDDNGDFDGTSGSWQAGISGAQPGVIMLANPTVGTPAYRQEFAQGIAEDEARVIGENETIPVSASSTPAVMALAPSGSYTGCLRNEEFTALEPSALEHKVYAPGIGLVLESQADGSEPIELVDIVTD